MSASTAAIPSAVDSSALAGLRQRPIAVLLFVIAVVASFATSNPWLTTMAIVSLSLVLVLVHRPGEPPILPFILGIQWTQVALKVFHADLLDVEVRDLDMFQGDAEAAIVIGLLAIVVLALGVFLGWRPSRQRNPDVAIEEARQFSVERFAWGYLAALALHAGLMAIAWVDPRFTQLVLAVASVKTMFVAAVIFVILANRRGYGYLVAVLLIEVIIGFSGFFSGFKVVLFVFVIMATAALRPVPRKRAAVLAAIVVLGVALSLVWTEIKGEYRDMISAGEGQQSVVIAWEDRMSGLAEAVSTLSTDAMIHSMDTLARRVAYTDFFAAALAYVPAYVPHTHGAVMGAALLHAVTPRMLFPDKPELSDNENVLLYTGIQISEKGSGTSIGLGYVGELYVDFGVAGMLCVMLVMGYLAGRIYRLLVGSPHLPLFVNYGLALTVLMPMGLFETSLVKTVAGVLILFLVTILVRRFALRYLIMDWFRLPQASARR